MDTYGKAAIMSHNYPWRHAGNSVTSIVTVGARVKYSLLQIGRLCIAAERSVEARDWPAIARAM
jgi:hypothetical protein